jgi:hypothetical protein
MKRGSESSALLDLDKSFKRSRGFLSSASERSIDGEFSSKIKCKENEFWAFAEAPLAFGFYCWWFFCWEEVVSLRLSRVKT